MFCDVWVVQLVRLRVVQLVRLQFSVSVLSCTLYQDDNVTLGKAFNDSTCSCLFVQMRSCNAGGPGS